MPVKYDWSIAFDPDQFIAFHGPTFATMLKQPARQATFRQALADLSQALQPAACWEDFPIKKTLHDRFLLANGKRLGGGPVVSVIGGAERLIAALCTAGPAVDELIAKTQQQKDLFKAMLLHDLASWAVDMIRQQLCHELEESAHQRGLRVSAPLSPGDSTWGLKDQAVIFSLLDAGQIGLSLSPSLVMRPLKSLSLIMGLGPRPMGVEGASNCDFCTLKDRCTYRPRRPR